MNEEVLKLQYHHQLKASSFIPASNKSLRKKLKEISTDLFLEHPVTTRINGVKINLYKLNQVAKAVGRSSSTLKTWEVYQIIPKASFRTVDRGHRLYCRMQIALLVYCIRKYNIGSGKGKKFNHLFSAEVWEHWKKVKDWALEPSESLPDKKHVQSSMKRALKFSVLNDSMNENTTIKNAIKKKYFGS
jgi:hypothetical protein